MKRLPIKVKVFFGTTYLITIISLLLSFKFNLIQLNSLNVVNIVFFSILVFLTETFIVLYKNISFSTTFVIQLASFMLFKPLFSIIILVLGFSIRVLKVSEKEYVHILNTPIYGTAFNCCVLIFPLICGNAIFQFIGGNFGFLLNFNNILALIIFSLTCFVLNTLMISVYLAINNNNSILYSFVKNISTIALNMIIMVPLGFILAYIFKTFSYIGIILAISPILIMRYTFSLYIETKSLYLQTVDAMMKAMEARDKYTEGHSQRVAKLAVMIAKELKYTEFEIEQLNMAALLHDIGKIGIDDHILNKPGRLTDEEFNIIRTHSEIGYDILKNIKSLSYAMSIVRSHHERYDGKGYPDGKSSKDLNLDVFIVQLADSIDAMATDRPYRKALTEDVIKEEVQKYAGTQFHPEVAKAYLRIVDTKIA